MTSWREMAIAQEAADLEVVRLELEVRDACESVEARESYWAAVMGSMPSWFRDVSYSSRPWLNRGRE